MAKIEPRGNHNTDPFEIQDVVYERGITQEEMQLIHKINWLQGQLAAAREEAERKDREVMGAKEINADLWADIRQLREQVFASRKRAEAAEAQAAELRTALVKGDSVLARAEAWLEAAEAALVPLWRVAEAARQYRQNCKPDGSLYRWSGFMSIALELDSALAALDAAQPTARPAQQSTERTR
jgi:chromosome segregation ATPase